MDKNEIDLTILRTKLTFLTQKFIELQRLSQILLSFKSNNTFKTIVPLSKFAFAQSTIPNPSSLYYYIGCNVYTEVTFDEALQRSSRDLSMLQDQIMQLKERIDQIQESLVRHVSSGTISNCGFGMYEIQEVIGVENADLFSKPTAAVSDTERAEVLKRLVQGNSSLSDSQLEDLAKLHRLVEHENENEMKMIDKSTSSDNFKIKDESFTTEEMVRKSQVKKVSFDTTVHTKIYYNTECSLESREEDFSQQTLNAEDNSSKLRHMNRYSQPIDISKRVSTDHTLPIPTKFEYIEEDEDSDSDSFFTYTSKGMADSCFQSDSDGESTDCNYEDTCCHSVSAESCTESDELDGDDVSVDLNNAKNSSARGTANCNQKSASKKESQSGSKIPKIIEQSTTLLSNVFERELNPIPENHCEKIEHDIHMKEIKQQYHKLKQSRMAKQESNHVVEHSNSAKKKSIFKSSCLSTSQNE